MKLEGPHMMILHAVIFGVISYLLMHFALGQNYNVAMNRTIILTCIVLTYMILFGHGLPTKLNPSLFK